MHRVVVTGVGVVTSIGIGISQFWPNLLAGRHGFKPISSFDTSRYKVTVGGEIPDFVMTDHLPLPPGGPPGRAASFALVAAHEALQDAGLPPGTLDPTSGGVVMGTTSGEPNCIESFNDAHLEARPETIDATFMATYPCHHMPGLVASAAHFTGSAPVMIPAACAAGNYAVAHGTDLLRTGALDVMLVGASDAFSRITYTGFHRLGAIAPDVCRPFDQNRQGMIPGEGAGFLVLERADHARARGASIYGEVAGYGLSCDAYHMTGGHPEGHGAVAAMEGALKQSGLTPEAVDYISAHGTGTPSNDRNETHSVKRVFGAHTRIPISSIKSMLGHTMGAASAIEAVTCALVLRHGRIPPTMHLETPDPDCDLDFVPGAAREAAVSVCMSNAYAFGGTNASIILKQFRS